MNAGAEPQRPNPWVRLSVRDTGCGMDANTQAHLFEPFFTTKEPGKGTGLGLATVYGIVQQSGGFIEVESQWEQGTTFNIYLPRAEACATLPEAEREPAVRASGSEMILLVEDEAIVRRLVRQVLDAQGYRVLEASRGEEALSTCRERGPEIDLLLTDVVMPGMSGPELAEHVAALQPGARVLFMSGYTDEAVARHGVDGAAVPFLQKPFTPAALARKIREVLETTAVTCSDQRV